MKQTNKKEKLNKHNHICTLVFIANTNTSPISHPSCFTSLLQLQSLKNRLNHFTHPNPNGCVGSNFHTKSAECYAVRENGIFINIVAVNCLGKKKTKKKSCCSCICSSAMEKPCRGMTYRSVMSRSKQNLLSSTSVVLRTQDFSVTDSVSPWRR